MPNHILNSGHKVVVFATRILLNGNLENFRPLQLQGWLFHVDPLANLLIL